MSNKVTTPEEAYQHLLIVKKVLLREGPVETANYFSSTIDRYQFGRMTLDEAALVRPAKTKNRITGRLMLEKRNESIRDAAALLFVTSYNQAAEDLARYIKEFYQMWTGGYKCLTEPDAGWSDLKTAVFWAFFFGSRSRFPPKTRKGLWPIVKQSTEV